MLKISIITPSYNQAGFLDDTIKSVINQNYPNLEYIIIDGGSTDGSVDIIKKYSDTLAYWVSGKDQGQSHAINKGFEKATGDIVAWLNSDDLYFPDTLATVAKIFEENPEVDLVYGDVENFYPAGKTAYYKVAKFETLDFLSRVSIHQPSVFWRRKVFETTGMLDTSFYYLMDYDLWMRIFFNFKTLKINKLLSKFRIHVHSKTHNNPPALYLDHRKVFCRFLLSCNQNTAVELLKNMNIWHNQEDVSYHISNIPNNALIEKAVHQYIYNCIVQEYTFKHIRNTNRLIFHKSNPLHFSKLLYTLIKNNLGIAYLKKT